MIYSSSEKKEIQAQLVGEKQPGLVCSRDKQRGMQCLVQAAKSAAQPAAGEEIRQTAVGAQMLCYQLED